MARQTISQVRAELARVTNVAQAQAAKLQVLQSKPRLPSIPLSKAILNASRAIQRKTFIERTGNDFPTTVDVELWLEELREQCGLA